MAVSVQAKRKRTLSYKITHVLSMTLKLTLPVVLFLTIFLLSSFYSQQNLKLLNQKKFFENQIIEIHRKLVDLDKNIESLMIGSEIIK
ncbi:hypothetical protein [Thermosipho atlanticus]|uniref:Uncharacterized protein n=1 Tax=Thermosipho atlanticus DSM 15807 TaxID=1123380 RepID=A0A1M5SS00_9BACT|nr:hypothetical protein [Thermosipho atlanticus]SHH41311.1 hypothetical protein SAMN02745199_1047 [Thermosipho atlanticus DSM 15807]